MFGFMSVSQSMVEGSQSRTLKAGTKVETTEPCCFLAFSSAKVQLPCLHRARLTGPRNIPKGHSGLVHATPIRNGENAPTAMPTANLMAIPPLSFPLVRWVK